MRTESTRLISLLDVSSAAVPQQAGLLALTVRSTQPRSDPLPLPPSLSLAGAETRPHVLDVAPDMSAGGTELGDTNMGVGKPWPYSW